MRRVRFRGRTATGQRRVRASGPGSAQAGRGGAGDGWPHAAAPVVPLPPALWPLPACAGGQGGAHDGMKSTGEYSASPSGNTRLGAQFRSRR